MVPPQSIRDDVRAELEDDVVGLWSIARAIADQQRVSDPESIKAETLAILRSLLVDPAIVFGQFHGSSFHPWPESGAAVVDRIAREWVVLGHPPDIGDLGWLSLRHQ